MQAPAAIAGAALASLGIESGSVDALRYIPVIALFVGLWLAFVLFFESGQARYIYFNSGYGRFYQRNRLTIILMQIPKIMEVNLVQVNFQNC